MCKMRGGSQACLMLGEDKNFWVVKFQNNPQHLFVLANEYIGTQLAQHIGLSVPTTAMIEVPPALLYDSADLTFEMRGPRVRYASGLQFGSRFVGGANLDFLPEPYLRKAVNLNEFAGILCFDKWTGNTDARQAVFIRKRNSGYRAVFIDQGFCFNGGDWTFPDSPLRGAYSTDSVYAKVTGWESLEPWLSRIEQIEPSVIEQILSKTPLEWYGGDVVRSDRLFEKLLRRRSRVRDLITAFRQSDRNPFPNWR